GRQEDFPAVSPLDQEDLVPDLARGACVEPESAVERRRIEPARGRQQLTVLETVRPLDALADDDAERVRLGCDVARIAPEHPPEFGAEPGRGRADRRSLVQMRLPLAWPDHALGKHAELPAELIRTRGDTRDGLDRCEPPPLPDDGDVVLESPGDHEEV